MKKLILFKNLLGQWKKGLNADWSETFIVNPDSYFVTVKVHHSTCEASIQKGSLNDDRLYCLSVSRRSSS